MPDPFNVEEKFLTEDKARNNADVSWDSPFHTLGAGSTQAAPGNHKHSEYLLPSEIIQGSNITIEYDEEKGTVKISGAAAGAPGTVDHGGLLGLTDDDHTQYYNQSRGDARYSRTTHTHSTYSLTSHDHDGIYALINHTHSYTQAGIRAGTYDVGTVTSGSSKGPFTVSHGLGKTPVAILLTPRDDTGAMSLVASVNTYSSGNFTFSVRNIGGADEAGKVAWLVVG